MHDVRQVAVFVLLAAALSGCVNLDAAREASAFDEDAFAWVRMKTHGMT